MVFSDIAFVIAAIYAMVNGAVFLSGKPTTWSWTEVFLKTNGFLTAILAAGWMPWILIFGFEITSFKIVFGVWALAWFGAVFGIPAYMTKSTSKPRNLRR